MHLYYIASRWMIDFFLLFFFICFIIIYFALLNDERCARCSSRFPLLFLKRSNRLGFIISFGKWSFNSKSRYINGIYQHTNAHAHQEAIATVLKLKWWWRRTIFFFFFLMFCRKKSNRNNSYNNSQTKIPVALNIIFFSGSFDLLIFFSSAFLFLFISFSNCFYMYLTGLDV